MEVVKNHVNNFGVKIYSEQNIFLLDHFLILAAYA